MVGPSSAINATLYEKLGFHFLRDIAPVAAIVRSPNVMLVNPSVPARTVAEFIALAKANPGKLSMASAGVGTATHLAGEMFKMMTGVNMVHVAYRGGAGAYADLIAGQVDVYFPALASALGYIKRGELRALAVTTPRWRGLDIPTVAIRAGLRGQHLVWHRRAAEHARRHRRAAQPGDQRGARRSRGRGADCRLGGTVVAGSPADFGRLIAEETDKWAKVIKFSGTALS